MVENKSISTLTHYMFFCGTEEKDELKRTEAGRNVIMFCPDFESGTDFSNIVLILEKVMV